MKTILLTTLLVMATAALGQSKQKVIYKYKQYEKFDLGDMEIKGSVIAPGDLSIKERRRKVFKRNLMEKSNFDHLIIQDVKYLR